MGNISAYKKNRLKKIKTNYKDLTANVSDSSLVALYDKLENSFVETAFYKAYKLIASKSGYYFGKFKRSFSRSFENSVVLNFINDLPQFLFEKSLRYYGVGLFFFGFFYLAFSLVANINKLGDTAIITQRNFLLIFPGILNVIAASFMMVSQKTVASQILQSKLFSFLLFELFNFDRKFFEKISPQRCSHTLPIIVGMAVGIATIVISPLTVLKLLFFILLFTVIMRSPENGIIGTCLVIPFVKPDALIGLLILVAISYSVKALRLKRVCKFGIMDAVLTVFATVVFFCGVVSANISGSLEKLGWFILCLFFGFIVSNTIRTSKLIGKCLKSLIISVSVAAFFSILSFIVKKYDLQSLNEFTRVFLNFPASFPLNDGGNIYEIFVLLIPFMLSKRSEKGLSAGTNALISFLLLIGAVFLSFDTSVWFMAIAAVIIYICFIRPAFAFPTFAASTVVLTLAGIFPKLVSTISKFIGNVLGVGFDFHKLLNSDNIGTHLLGKTTLFGLGLGDEAIENAISYNFGSGFIGASDGMTFFLRVILEIGLFGALVLLLANIMFFVYGYGIYYNEKIVSVYKPYVASAVASVTAALVKGIVFPSITSLQSFLILCISIYLCTSIKQTALLEYVPKAVELSGDSY